MWPLELSLYFVCVFWGTLQHHHKSVGPAVSRHLDSSRLTLVASFCCTWQGWSRGFSGSKQRARWIIPSWPLIPARMNWLWVPGKSLFWFFFLSAVFRFPVSYFIAFHVAPAFLQKVKKHDFCWIRQVYFTKLCSDSGHTQWNDIECFHGIHWLMGENGVEVARMMLGLWRKEDVK